MYAQLKICFYIRKNTDYSNSQTLNEIRRPKIMEKHRKYVESKETLMNPIHCTQELKQMFNSMVTDNTV